MSIPLGTVTFANARKSKGAYYIKIINDVSNSVIVQTMYHYCKITKPDRILNLMSIPFGSVTFANALKNLRIHVLIT